ncbi:DegT/DnrJ/EryC1/StrS family aminotransferase [Luteimicrobium subarcticum]|uniref:dTDP-4-amino-4,6-dideoxygalactose transaminase n=1 Tax=Luteimicrobium subarcticum TaxID=620910 RepID=A0A2M8W450_9MICO|nr:DegT/DnrJ/EryC1/StrS family aminotransferase [Luteimicrobium subarcticum]PJI85679.1 dTDP-4-amino-4,6-dideoxygalactose transaminase [Luteimicrobium subarcticum]
MTTPTDRPVGTQVPGGPVPSAAEDRVRALLAERTGTDPADWFLVFKARYGMEVVFRALAAVRGAGDVATQVLTCSTAVDPILVGGLRPVYGEVSPASVALDPERLVVTPTTRAVVAQHTFGIVDDARTARLRAVADRVGALLVEDAAHCVTRLARGADGRPLADVSIHSFGVEKMLPTRFGGAVWVNPELGGPDGDGLRRRVTGDLAALPAVGRRIDLAARMYRTEVRVLNRLPHAAAGPVRSTLTQLGAFEPAIAPVEAQGGLRYEPMRPSEWMAQQIAAQLPSLDAVEHGRAAAVRVYLHELGGVVEIPSSAHGPLVRFPFFAADHDTAERVLAALARAGHYAGRWYRPALFPGVDDPAVYGYTPGVAALATTEGLISRVVNLPTTVDPEQAHRIAAVVRSVIADGSSRT